MNETSGLRPSADVGIWRRYADALVVDLEARGLEATAVAHGAVRATNPAGQVPKDDPRGQLMSVDLGQEVYCRPRGEDGALWWWWAWSGPTRQSPPDLEPLCLAEDAEQAAERIARVLEVPFADRGER